MPPPGVDYGFPATRSATPQRSTLPRALEVIEPSSTVGVGSLPHRDARAAAAFAFAAYDVPSVPSLPRRSPSESAIAQALGGVAGANFGPYGALVVDAKRLDKEAPVKTDLGSDAFAGFAAFLRHAASIDYRGPVKWHFIGPVSVGVALRRAGADLDLAFTVALHVVRQHMMALAAATAEALPHCPQLVIVNEPMLERDTIRELTIPLLMTADMVSSAMAAVENVADVGVHCCRGVDLDLLIEAGPHVVSLPTFPHMLDATGVLGRFLEHGGWVSWGVVNTEGPIGMPAKRSWQQLVEAWHVLARRGIDIELLAARSMLTPQCGLGVHTPVVAERVSDTLREVARLARGASIRLTN